MSKFSDRFRELPRYLRQIDSNLAEQARNTNLVDFLSSKGETLKKVDNRGRYHLAEHDSLIVRGSFFWWNSRGLEGNAIDFMKVYYGMEFKEAVAELTNTALPTIEKRLASATNTLQVSREFSLPDLTKDMRRTFAYLIKTRHIDPSIVQKLAKEKLILQDQRGNIVFPWVDNGQIIGAELTGTLTDKRFKGVVADSKYGHGYNITIGSPKRLCVFESAIDLLSFWSHYKYKLEDVLLVSMAGLKEEVIKGFLNRYNGRLDVYLAVDNDKAGDTFIQTIQAEIEALPKQPPEQFKDWNDYLKHKSQNQL